MGLVSTSEWIFKIIGDRGTSFLVKRSCQLIFFACTNGSYDIIKWAIEKVEKFGFLKKEMNGIYDAGTGERATLLSILCHFNIQDTRPIKLLREKGFPVLLLRDINLGRKNVLEKALLYKNLKMVKEILDESSWVRKLICSENELQTLKRRVLNLPEFCEILEERFHQTRLS